MEAYKGRSITFIGRCGYSGSFSVKLSVLGIFGHCMPLLDRQR